VLGAAVLVLAAAGAEGGVTLTSLHSFQVSTNGINPAAGLVRGSDGSFYGTTEYGGTNGGNGTVFKISTNGVITSLYSFTGGNDGSSPGAGLVQGSDGFFYGTTEYGGTNGDGTVFKISSGGALTSLYSFTGGIDGSIPQAGLVQASDGFFYGTTESGGTNDFGAVFKISSGGTLTRLYSFMGGNDGAEPEAGLVQGSDGFLYGTTELGGNTNLAYGAGVGTVFKISTGGALTTLHDFGAITNSSGEFLDGANPIAGLLEGTGGIFYGTTESGGTNGAGSVFKMSSGGTLTSLYAFSGISDGSDPVAGLVQAGNGFLYGTTEFGGSNDSGTIFQIGTNGGLMSLYSFTGTNDGNEPAAGLAEGPDGMLYGTTEFGGTNASGAVFQISTGGEFGSLYSFSSLNDGADPEAGLVQGSDGNFYGTTEYGGTNDAGTVFRISANGIFTNLYLFTGGNDGGEPEAGLIQANGGFFYGTTFGGGANFRGTVFQMSSTGALTNLYSFTGVTDGEFPEASLLEVSDGIFCGTTSDGQAAGQYGTVYQISAAGAQSNLYSFTNGFTGAFPAAALARGSDGNFYGTTFAGGTDDFNSQGYGTIFKITSGGMLTSLYSFTNGVDGSNPEAGLVQGGDGNFYGTTEFGGSNGYGAVFKISPGGEFNALYSFTGTNDGSYPIAGLALGSDGYFYGTTESGGAYTNQSGQSFGTVFKINTNGTLAALYSFTGGNDGGSPAAGLVLGSDGSFYGTTAAGGEGAAGTVFRLSVGPAAPVFESAMLSNGMLVLTWSTEAGGNYQLQFTSNLNSRAWTDLGGALAATGATLGVTNALSHGPQAFYRVEVVP
jgi:uncharacterized repeat protein (TIGR03803 family)